MNKRLLINLMLLLVLGFAACTSGKDNKETETTNLEGNDYLITIKTDLGEMKAILHDLTPLHKENFVKLAQEGFYDSLLFHRIIQGFMIQGGDPDSKGAPAGVSLGRGGPGYLVDAEITPELFHRKGALAAARTGGPGNPDRKSSGSQFYIVQGTVLTPEQAEINQVALSRAVGTLMRQYPQDTLTSTLRSAFNEGGQEGYIKECIEMKEEITEKTGIGFIMPADQAEVYASEGGTPQLDGEYTVFGQVISGLDVLDRIAAVQTQPGDRPVEDVKMFISVEQVPRSEIASKYSYTDFQ